MFAHPSVASGRILTRYVAPLGLTVLLRPGRAGLPAESLWIDSGEKCGIVLFMSALDAEIYRLHAQTIGEEWVRHPLETTGFQQTVTDLGQVWAHLVFAFNANAEWQLMRDSTGCLLLPSFTACFGSPDGPPGSATVRFRPSLFEAIDQHWVRIAGPGYAQTLSTLNRLGAIPSGATRLRELAGRALRCANVGRIGEPRYGQTDWAVFSTDADAWRLGPNQARQQLP